MILLSAGIQIESRFTLIPETAWVLAQQTFRNHPNYGANSDTTKRPICKIKGQVKVHLLQLPPTLPSAILQPIRGLRGQRSSKPQKLAAQRLLHATHAARRLRHGAALGVAQATAMLWRSGWMWRLACKLRGDKVIYVGWRRIPTERFAMDVYIYVYLHHYAANGLILNNQRVVLGAIWLEHLWARRNRNRM
jgi:hypothetical protein